MDIPPEMVASSALPRSEHTASGLPEERIREGHHSVPKLITLIQNAARVIEEHYSAASTSPEYRGIPSLEETDPHPLDDEFITTEMREAVQIIEGACEQLVSTVAKPRHTLTNRFMEFYYSTCINVALKFKVADILQDKPNGLHISEIEEKTGVEQDRIGRVLRLLASRHIFKEVSKNVFANNRLSIQLVSNNPLSDFGLHFTEEAMKWSLSIPDVLGDKDWGHSQSVVKSAFNKSTGCPEPLFDFYNHDPAGAERGTRFSRGIMSWASASESHSMIDVFPWDKLGSDVSVCDIGSGVGTKSIELAKAHPNLCFILQDKQERLQQAQNEVWPQEMPSALAENRVQFVPLDFFAEPPVAGCDVYYLKHTIHNWPDESAVKILSNIKNAMAPHSRVLVHEYILQHGNRVPESEAEVKQAPKPLLPNYGAGGIRQYNLDLQMMCVFNSEIRDLGEFIKVGEDAGLKFVKVWDVGETSIIEYRRE